MSICISVQRSLSHTILSENPFTITARSLVAWIFPLYRDQHEASHGEHVKGGNKKYSYIEDGILTVDPDEYKYSGNK